MARIRRMAKIRLVRLAQIATLTLLAAGLALLITGCGAVSSPISTTATTGQAIAGRVRGGQQAVVGARVYLMAAGTNGYGGPSDSLLNPQFPGVSTDSIGAYVLTDNSGSFSIGGAYTCTPGQQVYLFARGGNPGFASGAGNPALALIAAFGACPDSGNFAHQIPLVNLNEVTTVAAVYALAGYMTDPIHLSAPSTTLAQQGLANAFLAAINLVDLSTGAALTATRAGNGFPPQATINSLANMLSACVNSTGSTAACTTLFANTRDANGVTPTDTVTVALNIAHNPGVNVAPLYALSIATPPFQPSLTSVPNDWTVAITYYVEFMAGPYYPAIDAQGYVWIPGYANNTLTQLDPLGIPLSGLNGYSGNSLNQPFAIAIDSAQNAWVANYAYGAAAVTARFTPNGSASGNFACGTNCTGVALDAYQDVWTVAASGTTVIHNSGLAISQFSTSAPAPGIAIDSVGRAWTIGKDRSLYRLTLPNTLTPFPQTVTSALPNDLNMLAIDSSDNVWFTSGKNNALGRFEGSSKSASAATSYTGGGLNYPAQLAVDGANRIWVANRDGNSISAFRNDGSAITSSTGYRPSGQVAPDSTVPVTAVGIRSPHGLAIDGSGNIWVTNFTANSVTEFVGLATPTATPLSSTNHGQRP
jgi:streptogramin lyase